MLKTEQMHNCSLDIKAKVADINPAPIIQVDFKGNILYRNESASFLTDGQDTRNISQIFDVITPEFLTAIKENTLTKIESNFQDKLFEIKMTKDFEHASIYLFFTETTEYGIIHNKLKESQELFNVIINNNNFGIFITDENGRVSVWNRIAEETFGYTIDELRNHNIFDILFPGDYKIYNGSKNLKTIFTSETYQSPLSLISVRSDHSKLPIELIVSIIEQNDQTFILGFTLDISERARIEEEFKQEISQYIAMINTVPAMMYVKDIDLRYVIANETFCNFIGKSLNSIKGKTDYDILPPDAADLNKIDDIKVLDENRVIVRHEESVTDEQGNKKWYSSTKVPIHDKQGLVSGIVSLIQDITEIKMSREKLIQSDKLAAIGTLAAGVAHEINNPIGFINSNLNTMSKYLVKIQDFITKHNITIDDNLKDIFNDFQDAISESNEGTNRVKKIVADLKSFSRVDKAESEAVNINEGIDSILNIVWNELKYKCKIEKEYGDLPDLFCFPNQINQVIMNLLVNASHAIRDEKGLIKIKTWNDNNNIYVSISDNGIGISKQNINKIFEPFFTTKEVGKGTGLGLSLVYDIIKKHKGSIDVKSQVGVGSVFTITLPFNGVTKDA